MLDQLERQTLADRHVAAVFMAAGAKEVDLPTIADQRRLLDAALVDDLKSAASEVDTEQMELRRALGVA